MAEMTVPVVGISKPKGANTLLFILVILLAVVLYFGVYKMHFQFNAQDVKDYINEEVSKHPVEQQPAIYKLIRDGVQHILSDRNLTQQVLTRASMNKTPREMELVHSAIMQNLRNGYLNV